MKIITLDIEKEFGKLDDRNRIVLTPEQIEKWKKIWENSISPIKITSSNHGYDDYYEGKMYGITISGTEYHYAFVTIVYGEYGSFDTLAGFGLVDGEILSTLDI